MSQPGDSNYAKNYLLCELGVPACTFCARPYMDALRRVSAAIRGPSVHGRPKRCRSARKEKRLSAPQGPSVPRVVICCCGFASIWPTMCWKLTSTAIAPSALQCPLRPLCPHAPSAGRSASARLLVNDCRTWESRMSCAEAPSAETREPEAGRHKIQRRPDSRAAHGRGAQVPSHGHPLGLG